MAAVAGLQTLKAMWKLHSHLHVAANLPIVCNDADCYTIDNSAIVLEIQDSSTNCACIAYHLHTIATLKAPP